MKRGNTWGEIKQRKRIKREEGKLVLWSAISCLNLYWLVQHVWPATHSRLLNGGDLVARVMNPSALWYSRTRCSLPLPDLDTNDLSHCRHGTDKLTSCSILPNFHIICGTYLTLFKWCKCVSAGRSLGRIINLHVVCKHMWSWVGL